MADREFWIQNYGVCTGYVHLTGRMRHNPPFIATVAYAGPLQTSSQPGLPNFMDASDEILVRSLAEQSDLETSNLFLPSSNSAMAHSPVLQGPQQISVTASFSEPSISVTQSFPSTKRVSNVVKLLGKALVNQVNSNFDLKLVNGTEFVLTNTFPPTSK